MPMYIPRWKTAHDNVMTEKYIKKILYIMA